MADLNDCDSDLPKIPVVYLFTFYYVCKRFLQIHLLFDVINILLII